MQTPASTAADNAREESYDLNVALDGSASGTFSSTLTGSLALTLRGRLLSAPKKKTNEMILGELSLLHPAVLDDIHVDGTEPPALPTPIHVAGKITRPLVRGGLRGDTALRGSRVLGESALPTIADQHVGPLLLGAPMREHVVVKLRLPHGAVPGTLPPPASAEAAFGSYRAQWSLDGAALVYERTIVVSQRIVDEQALDDARAFFRGALSADASPLVIAFAGDR